MAYWRSPPVCVVTVTPHAVANPFTLWHLTSLDAPTVAVLWTFFPARLMHVPLPPATLIAMALVVWALYAADRLLDTAHLPANSTALAHIDLEPRHLFHHRHRTSFLVALGVASILLAGFLPHLARPAIHIYLAEAALMAGYFLLIHAAPKHQRRAIPKELLVGLFFAAATFIPTISRVPSLRPTLLPCALLFAALCTLNCLYIYAWEHPLTLHPDAATRLALRFLPHLACVILALALSLVVFPKPLTRLALYPTASALSIVVLLLLDRARHRLSHLVLRTAADAALLTPLLFLPWL